MTKPVTRKMAVDCLLWRFFTGANIPREGEQGCDIRQAIIACGICGNLIFPEDDIQFDHIHADVFDGPHEYKNLRPVHTECHKIKTKADVQAKAKGDRILGLTKTGPKRKIPSRPMGNGRGFPPKGSVKFKKREKHGRQHY